MAKWAKLHEMTLKGDFFFFRKKLFWPPIWNWTFIVIAFNYFLLATFVLEYKLLFLFLKPQMKCTKLQPYKVQVLLQFQQPKSNWIHENQMLCWCNFYFLELKLKCNGNRIFCILFKIIQWNNNLTCPHKKTQNAIHLIHFFSLRKSFNSQLIVNQIWNWCMNIFPSKWQFLNTVHTFCESCQFWQECFLTLASLFTD